MGMGVVEMIEEKVGAEMEKISVANIANSCLRDFHPGI